jgi:hypothetical protein
MSCYVMYYKKSGIMTPNLADHTCAPIFIETSWPQSTLIEMKKPLLFAVVLFGS